MWRKPLSRQQAPLDCGPQCTPPISIHWSPDALSWGRKELFHSNSKFTEEQPRNWKLNIYLGTNVLLP